MGSKPTWGGSKWKQLRRSDVSSLRVSLLKTRKRERKCFHFASGMLPLASTAGQSCFHLASHDHSRHQTHLLLAGGSVSDSPTGGCLPVRRKQVREAVRSIRQERLCETHCSAGDCTTAGRGSTRRESEAREPRLRSNVPLRQRYLVSRVMDREKSGSGIDLVDSQSPNPASEHPRLGDGERNLRPRAMCATLAYARGTNQGTRSSGAC